MSFVRSDRATVNAQIESDLLAAIDLLDVIWYERRCEFACEGDRWFDLVRTGRAEEVMTDFCANKRLEGKFTLTWNKKMNYLPVSLDEETICPTIDTYPSEAL